MNFGANGAGIAWVSFRTRHALAVVESTFEKKRKPVSRSISATVVR